MDTNDREPRNTYYVATLARYVLVRAGNPEEAKRMGEAELGKPARAVRLATADELALQAFHERMRHKWR